jgi:hypothetical protein
MRLPDREEGKFKLWQSGGSTPEFPLPMAVTAMQQPEEILLITTMLAELRSKLAVNLDPSPSFESFHQPLLNRASQTVLFPRIT